MKYQKKMPKWLEILKKIILAEFFNEKEILFLGTFHTRPKVKKNVFLFGLLIFRPCSLPGTQLEGPWKTLKTLTPFSKFAFEMLNF